MCMLRRENKWACMGMALVKLCGWAYHRAMVPSISDDTSAEWPGTNTTLEISPVSGDTKSTGEQYNMMRGMLGRQGKARLRPEAGRGDVLCAPC